MIHVTTGSSPRNASHSVAANPDKGIEGQAFDFWIMARAGVESGTCIAGAPIP